MDLKAKLNQIDTEVIGTAMGYLQEGRYTVLVGVWQKGEAIGRSITIDHPPSWRQLERETGRGHVDLKHWHDLYQQYPNIEDYKPIALKNAQLWSQHQLASRQSRQIAESPILPKGKYQVIYADPPWEYRHCASDSRRIENQYPTLDLEKIKELDIPSDENAVCYMWATSPKLQEALEVLEVWEFDYRSSLVWDKEIIGMGYWFRGQHEYLLVGVKGEFPPPEQSIRISSMFKQQRGKHSQKPEDIRKSISKWYPQYAKLELFARDTMEGWTSWGDEIETGL